MNDLQFDYDEGILLQAIEVERYGVNEDTLEEMILTNKNIFCIYEKRNGLFSKPEKIVDKIPLESIKVVNGKAQIMQIVHADYGDVVQFVYKNSRREYFSFNEPEKEVAKWINTINTAITGDDTPLIVIDEPKKKKKLGLFVANKKIKADDKKQMPIEEAVEESVQTDNKVSTASAAPSSDLKSVTITEKQTNENVSKPISNDAYKVAYCSHCGQQLTYGAKFCSECGAPTQVAYQHIQANERRKEYVGSIRKCPACGEEITSFTAICPACGHELNSTKVSSTLERFMEQVNKCEELIANSQSPNGTGWSSWSKSKKVWWVIFNIFFTCIPLVIYLIIPLIRIKSTPKLSKEEKQMASLIENFPFPNDRESILEALVYTKEKIDFISKEKVDRKSAYWMRLWGSKAEQLKQKADLMFPNDTIVKQSYAEILADENRVNNIIKMKALAGVAILVLAIIYVFVRNGTIDDIRTANTVLEIPETELSSVMPQIEGGKGKVVTNNSTYFSVEYYGISDSEFENYKKVCKEQGFTIDCENTGSLFDAYNSDGYNIRITYYSKEMHITVTDAMEMRTIKWPDSEVANLLPKPKSNYGNISTSRDNCLIVYIGNTTIDDYIEYVSACIEKGFDKDLRQSDDHYHADNADGYHVVVEYRGFNTIFIRIDD